MPATVPAVPVISPAIVEKSTRRQAGVIALSAKYQTWVLTVWLAKAKYPFMVFLYVALFILANQLATEPTPEALCPAPIFRLPGECAT